jgi:tetratricopeptide (TPR) repeat protein
MTALLEMSGTFRNQLLNLEESLSSVQSRSQELAMESQIATECNQLAWLLAKCKHETKEALELSLRSVELKPTTPAYLDTLARCYYENGRLDDAIAAQQKACGLSPHDRQLSGQLEEFLRLRDEANEKAGRSR